MPSVQTDRHHTHDGRLPSDCAACVETEERVGSANAKKGKKKGHKDVGDTTNYQQHGIGALVLIVGWLCMIMFVSSGEVVGRYGVRQLGWWLLHAVLAVVLVVSLVKCALLARPILAPHFERLRAGWRTWWHSARFCPRSTTEYIYDNAETAASRRRHSHRHKK